MKYYICVKYANAEALHLSHDDIKICEFVLNSEYDDINEALKDSRNYINNFMDKMGAQRISSSVPLVVDNQPDGYICTEDPERWHITTWYKVSKYFKNWAAEKLFELTILPSYTTDEEDHDEYKRWIAKDSSLFFED